MLLEIRRVLHLIGVAYCQEKTWGAGGVFLGAGSILFLYLGANWMGVFIYENLISYIYTYDTYRHFLVFMHMFNRKF